MATKTEISAGGIVVRKATAGWQVLLICDPKANWTFPKGLIEKGEDPRSAGIREVAEESGVKRLRLLTELPSIHYMYHREGLVKKTVHYFLFESRSRQVLKAQKEEGITDVRWVPLAQAIGMLGYPKTNVPLLTRAADILSRLKA